MGRRGRGGIGKQQTGMGQGDQQHKDQKESNAVWLHRMIIIREQNREGERGEIGKGEWSEGGKTYRWGRRVAIQYFAMIFEDYSEFLQPEADYVGYITSSKKQPYTESPPSPFRPTPIPTHHDLFYSEFTETIARRLLPQPYPSSLLHFNPLCPLCLLFVSASSGFTTCFLSGERQYLVHLECLRREPAYEQRSLGQLPENKVEWLEEAAGGKYGFEMGLDSRQFLAELALTHPLSDKCFLKVNRKVALVRDHFTLDFNPQKADSFSPNLLLLPLADYHLTVVLTEIATGIRSRTTSHISFRTAKDKKRVILSTDFGSMRVEITDDLQQKQRLVDEMNYKYRYPLDLPLPLLRIMGFTLNLPEEFTEESEEFILGGSSAIVEDLLNEKQTPSLSTIKTSEHSPDKRKRSVTDSSSQQPGETEINLEKLINGNCLVEFVKIKGQSLQFQNYLMVCSPAEIAVIIAHISPSFLELILHEYGNYMAQKLFAVCQDAQRLYLLQLIGNSLPELIRTKQGTHTMQAFIDSFRLAEEFEWVAYQLSEDYYDLSRDLHATHYVQKVIRDFPLPYTLPFFHYTSQNLQAFALDKHAMCVVKQMMRRLRELEQKDMAGVEAVRRQLLTEVTFGVDRLINDSFGNYVIQFSYQLFAAERCAGITERILSRFAHYATGRYSSNVLVKCISTFWTDRRLYLSLRGLSNAHIADIFRNKDGNRVLLEMMELLEGTEIWDRLYSVLMKLEVTRFYHDRWGVCLGSRSGQVATELSGFPEPSKNEPKKKKQYTKRT